MIALHRLAHPDDPFLLNPDTIVSVEAHPDTVITLSTGARVVVAEDPETIRADVRTWRASVLALAVHDLPRHSAGMVLVHGGAAPIPVGPT